MPLLIVLDRDGVINQDSEKYITSPTECLPIDGSLEAIALLQEQGHSLAVATNQSGIARGYFLQETLDAMHEKLNTLLIQKGGRALPFFFCPHMPDAGCPCRKPQTGLLEQILNHYPAWSTQKDKIFFIGDALSDLEAGLSFGVQPVLVLTGKGLKTKEKMATLQEQKWKDIPQYSRLAEACQALCS
jgi:D-glycero-D-manno-heptose 1,7-bisphosphate phosphatase